VAIPLDTLPGIETLKNTRRGTNSEKDGEGGRNPRGANEAVDLMAVYMENPREIFFESGEGIRCAIQERLP
jgi:hypothetical protein